MRGAAHRSSARSASGRASEFLFEPTGSAEGRTADSKIFSAPLWREIAHVLDLSDRELQIVLGIFDDKTAFAVSRRLGISVHTVHTHLERLYHKLAVHRRPSLIVRVMAGYQTLSDDGRHHSSASLNPPR